MLPELTGASVSGVEDAASGEDAAAFRVPRGVKGSGGEGSDWEEGAGCGCSAGMALGTGVPARCMPIACLASCHCGGPTEPGARSGWSWAQRAPTVPVAMEFGGNAFTHDATAPPALRPRACAATRRLALEPSAISYAAPRFVHVAHDRVRHDDVPLGGVSSDDGARRVASVSVPGDPLRGARALRGSSQNFAMPQRGAVVSLVSAATTRYRPSETPRVGSTVCGLGYGVRLQRGQSR